MGSGLGEREAADTAVARMGEPTEIGALLNDQYRPQPIGAVSAIIAVIALAGLALRIYVNLSIPDVAISHEIYGLIFVIAAAVIGYYLNYSFLSLMPKSAFLLYSAVILLTALLPRLFDPAIFNMDYSAYLFILYPVFLAGVIYNSRPFHGVKAALCIAFQAIPVLIYSCLGTVTIALPCALLGIFLITVAARGSKALVHGGAYICAAFALNAAILGIAVAVTPGLLDTLNAFFAPGANPDGRLSITLQLQEVLRQAEFIGHSSGNLPQALQFNSSKNYLLAFLIYKWGWIALAAIIGLCVLVVASIYRCALRQTNILGQILSKGIAAMIFLETACYVLTNTRFGALYTLPLPFVSTGNISLILHGFIIGLLLSAVRKDRLPMKEFKEYFRLGAPRRIAEKE